MAQSNRLIDLVQARIDRFLESRTSIFASISDDLSPFEVFSRQFLSGGKRFRAQFCYWGWRSVCTEGDELTVVVGAASALELFHAAALVHDDIIDRSDTRRGAASAHKRFETMHRESRYSGSAADFGTASALLLGDLLQSWSDELFEEALGECADRFHAIAARGQFNRMRTEVTAGQYLDILEESAWSTRDQPQQLAAAQRVIVYKSAKYSVEAPLSIGASLGGATIGQLDALRAFGLPLGIAYQLRDDVLGVFGDSKVTGKPSGDDLREGKRTVLIALAEDQLPASQRQVLDELLGDHTLDADQIRMLQRAIRDSGALDKVERLITAQVDSANAALDEAPLSDEAIGQLRALTRTATDRRA